MPKIEGATLRAFVALDLDPPGLRRMGRLADRLRMASGAPAATWTPADKMHVTLKFAAALPEGAVEPLKKALGPIVEGKPAPKACAVRVGAFPSPAKATVVVAELADEDGDIAALAAKVEKLVARHGIAPEKRAFRPHVTLARVKLAYDARRWLRPALDEIAGECGFAGVTLYESVLASAGSTYAVLGRWLYSTSTHTS